MLISLLGSDEGLCECVHAGVRMCVCVCLCVCMCVCV